jgi:hypothetical protein
MKKIFKYFLYLILFPLIGLYFSIAYIFTLFPKDTPTTVKTKNIAKDKYNLINTCNT